MAATRRHLAVTLVFILALLVLPASALAALTPSPAPYDFGNVDRYSTSPSQTFTFTNGEGMLVNVSSVSLTGTNASEFSTLNDNCSGKFLNDGDSCTVAVQIHPASSGAKTASLDVDDGLGIASVALTANAQAGSLGVSPNPIALNPQPWYFGSANTGVNVQTSSFGTTISNVSLSGPDAPLFSLNFNGCNGTTLFSFTSCGVGVQFNPTGPSGPANANLVITSDSPSSPTTTAITADALSGPHPVPSPANKDFGSVKVGSSSGAQTFHITNTGDFALQVQQLFVVSGTPQAFPIANDNCSGNIVPPGDSCTVQVSFVPSAAGLKEGSVFIIANTPGPVTQIELSGQAYPAPSAAAVVAGTPAVGDNLTCKTSSVSGDLSFQWLREGKAIPGATGSSYEPTNADYGKRLACRVTASNPIGSVSADSPQTAPLAARDLSREPHSLVDAGSCRVASVQAIAGVSVRGTDPATPESPLTFSSSKPVRVELGSIDKRSKRVRITPRQLSSFDDGPQSLTVNGKSTSLVLAPCRLSASVTGSATSQVTYELSGSIGIKSGSIKTEKLKIKAGKGVIGEATVFAHGQPETHFLLTGERRTSYNGIKVKLSHGAVQLSGLPGDTGTVDVQLNHGHVSGTGGTAKAAATLKGGVAARASVQTLWK